MVAGCRLSPSSRPRNGRAGARHQVEVARAVDEEPRPHVEQAALGQHRRRADGAAAARDLGELAVQQHAHARLVGHLVEHDLQDLGVVFDAVHAMAGRHHEMAVAAAAAHRLQALHDLLGEARDHAPAGPGLPADELADRARRGGAAQEAMALEQHGARTLAGSGDGGHGSRHSRRRWPERRNRWDSFWKPTILRRKEEREAWLFQHPHDAAALRWAEWLRCRLRPTRTPRSSPRPRSRC